MQLIPIDPPARRGPSEQAQEALAGVIATIGAARFGTAALAQLNRWMPLCWLSVYRLNGAAPPVIHAAGSHGVADGTGESWRVYRAGLYLRDATFAEAWTRVRNGAAVLTQWDAREIPMPHRRAIYRRHGLRERLSLVQGTADGALLAVNVYRHEGQPAFADREVDALRDHAASLLACVSRHVELSTCAARPAGSVLDVLTRREREVCDAILRGLTFDGIGAMLGITAATVRTYRDRAFERLGLGHRNELFALMVDEARRPPH